MAGNALKVVPGKISEAVTGVYSRCNGNPNEYWLTNTGFEYNTYGFWDEDRITALSVAEGIINCSFTANGTGVLAGSDLSSYLPDYNHGAFTGNSFANNRTGISGKAGNITLANNRFENNAVAGISLKTTGNLQFNIIDAPAGAAGITALDGNRIRGNTMQGSGNGSTAVRVKGTKLSIADNSFTGFETGVWLDGANSYAASATDVNAIEGNTFTDCQTGVKLTSDAGAYGLGVPEIRCNTFSAPNLGNTKGIYLGPNVVMRNYDHPAAPTTPNEMGGPGSTTNPTTPFGNLFIGITEPVRNDGGILDVMYYVYQQSNDDILPTATAIGMDFEEADVFGTDSECKLTYTTGVQARIAGKPVNKAGDVKLEVGLGFVFPNPAQSQATVPYFLPSGTVKAKLILREAVTGRIVGTYALLLQPKGSLQLDVSYLRNGIYGYTLEADRKLIATRLLEVKH